MKFVQEVINAREKQLEERPFCKRLERNGPLEDIIEFIPELTFFAMAFQDLLRLNEGLIQDPRLREVAGRHRVEDGGHDLWFLKDLEILDCTPDIRWLFSPRMAAPRDTAYQLIAESYRATHDIARIALILALEAAAECFFSRAPGYIQRAGYEGPIQYFSKKHHEVEKAHQIHEACFLRALDDLVLSTSEREEAVAVVHRTFDRMTTMFDFFEANIEHRRSHPSNQTRVWRGLREVAR